MKLTIIGNVPSKKNSKKLFFIRNRPIFAPSTNYEKWHKQALPQLLGKSPVEGQIKDIELIFYPESKRKSDLTNKAESIMDLLVDAGIIEDDNWFVIPKVVLIFGGVDKNNPRCEITINVDTNQP